MSSILLSNPFVTPAPPPTNPASYTVSALAVAPIQGTAAGKGAGDAASFSGSGAHSGGGSDQHATAALMRTHLTASTARPADATARSIIDAQAKDGEAVMPFGSNLPPVEMPDPLPTSPFLKRG